jgi:hypothetical protein
MGDSHDKGYLSRDNLDDEEVKDSTTSMIIVNKKY